MENLHHLKDLGYLNLALNNITKIDGLQYVSILTLIFPVIDDFIS